MFYKRPLLILIKGYLQFLFSVHHDGAVPGNRLSNGLARDEQKADRFGLRCYRHLIAVIKEHRGSIVNEIIALHVEIVHTYSVIGKRILLVAEDAFASDHIGKDGVAGLGLM